MEGGQELPGALGLVRSHVVRLVVGGTAGDVGTLEGLPDARRVELAPVEELPEKLRLDVVVAPLSAAGESPCAASAAMAAWKQA